LKYIEADGNVISDQVPVDFIADSMIVAAATFANQNKLSVSEMKSLYLSLNTSVSLYFYGNK